MTKHDQFLTTNALDDILLDIATQIELSPADRRVAENRYRRLKEHLERDTSPLAPYLIDGVSLIYAQGSIGTSTTIVSGTDDDRFDVDAIVEINVPAHWPDHYALDLLEEALQGFPGVVRIVRCTRCVQLQFPFMHMDVTIMDRAQRLAIERAGEIFHSPDDGDACRVPSNPWGFTAWFRSVVGVNQGAFVEKLRKRRDILSKTRLRALDDVEKALAKADQADLPPMIPSALDAQEAVALKLLKRYLNLRYETLDLKRPPSIYLAKRAGCVRYEPQGLTIQLIALSGSTAAIMRGHLATSTRPEEVNPSYPPDQINDRWPAEGVAGRADMEIFAEALEYLGHCLRRLARAPLNEIAKGIDELFGEKVGAELRRILADRFDRRGNAVPNLVQIDTGTVTAPAIVRSTENLRPVPEHKFHYLIVGDEDEDEC